MFTLEPDPTTYEATTNLSGGGSVTFDAPHPEASDTAEQHPVRFWLEVCPTSTETDPD